MGAFAELLHIRPWEIGRLTMPEFDGLCGYIDQHNKSASG